MDPDWRVMPDYESHERAREHFEWDIPGSYNPAVDLVGKHDPEDTALVQVPGSDATSGGDSGNADIETHTFGDLDRRSAALAGALETLGIQTGDRVGVCAPQCPETPLSHLACWKLGAVTIPLTTLFGPEALRYRLDDAGARAVVVAPGVREDVESVRAECDALEHVIEIGDGSAVAGDAHAFDDLVSSGPDAYEPHDSTPETDSAIIYTSGSTGPPKGVRHSHALWLGRAAAAYNFFDGGLDRDATCWTPADWAWGGALGGLVFGAWHHGAPVVGAPRRSFDPEEAFDLVCEHDVTHAFLPPTALRMLMTADTPDADELALEAIAAAGEPLTPEILEWADDLGVPVNEFYGQTELNLVVASPSRWFETRPGSMGKPLPGYDLAILDRETREPLDAGNVGEIAIEPEWEAVFFDEYWNQPEKTAAKRRGEWYLTGDLARRDGDGYIHFVSRDDDIILTSGYRVGPTEVERAILDHPDVEQVGVVGVPDETRGEIIKAFVQPAGREGSAAFREEIRDRVRENLAQYEYPREIEFVPELPTTTTGKIRRTELREREHEQ